MSCCYQRRIESNTRASRCQIPLDAVANALDETRPVFILEGVLPYLRREEVARCFSALSAIAPAEPTSWLTVIIRLYSPSPGSATPSGGCSTEFHFGIADARTYGDMTPRVRFPALYNLLRPIPWYLRKRALLPALAASRQAFQRRWRGSKSCQIPAELRVQQVRAMTDGTIHTCA